MPGFPDAFVLRPPEIPKKACECHACQLILRNSFTCQNCSINLCQSCLLPADRCPYCKTRAVSVSLAEIEVLAFKCPSCHIQQPLSNFLEHAVQCRLTPCLNFDRCHAIAFEQFDSQFCSKPCRAFYKARAEADPIAKLTELTFK